MLMRYHPGLAVGHIYNENTLELLASATSRDPSPQPENADSDSQSVVLTDATMDSMDRGWDDESEIHTDPENGHAEDTDDQEFIELHEMYNE